MSTPSSQLRVDYKPDGEYYIRHTDRPRVRRRFWLALLIVAASALVLQLIQMHNTSAPPVPGADHAQAVVSAAQINVQPALGVADMPLPVAATRAAVPAAGETSALTVRSGDNLGRLFAQHGLSQSDLAAILRSGPDAKGLRSVRVGQVVTVIHNDSGHVFGLSTSLDAARELIVQDTTQGYKASVGAIPFSTSRAYAHGVIENSLFDAAERAGLSDKVTMQLIHLFGWDIDFAHDVRSGDAFTVLYQKLGRQGEAETDGPILATEFTTQGGTYRMIRFQAPDGTVGYYTPKGNSVRKALLRAPVAFTRISSGFSLHRMNPVLHYIRPHYGTDYAAPMGTPIVAAGDGRIVFRGRKGGFGRCIVINDGGGYTTLYGHMSRFRAGQQVGSHVQQGEIIGFVGMSGEATGPHLHYQIMVHGVPRNPRTLKLPDGPPVPAKYRSAFLQEVNVLLAQMSNDANVRVAASSNAVGGGAAKVSRTQ